MIARSRSSPVREPRSLRCLWTRRAATSTRSRRSSHVAAAPLDGVEGGTGVTFTSSVLKTIAPGLRVGYFVVGADLASAYDDRAVSTYISPSLLPQAVVFELIDRGGFEPNLERVRGLLRLRRNSMLGAL